MLLDTSGLLRACSPREPFHQKAREEYQRASIRITHGYVLAELIALGNARSVPSPRVLEFVTSLIANFDIETVWPDEQMVGQALALLMARQGRGYSLCDALSFVLMNAKKIGDSLTTDRHFENEGFRRLLS